MCLSRAVKVSADCKVFRLQIDADPRLAAAAGAVARFLGEEGGLPGEAVAGLQKSIVNACIEAFEDLQEEQPHLTVTFLRYADRIEVALAHEGGVAPALGLDRIAGFADQLGNTTALSGVDRVQYEAREGLAITRFTKYLGHAPRIV
jgi:hypothetical protein